MSAESLHALEDFLGLVPIINGLFQCLILLPGQSDRDRLGLDLAGPLIAGAAGSRAPVLDIAVADPAQASQAGTEPGIFIFNLSEVGVHE